MAFFQDVAVAPSSEIGQGLLDLKKKKPTVLHTDAYTNIMRQIWTSERHLGT